MKMTVRPTLEACECSVSCQEKLWLKSHTGINHAVQRTRDDACIRIGSLVDELLIFDLDPLWWSASIGKCSPRLLIHERADLCERGMQSLLLTNWSASTLHSRVDVFCCLAILPSLARVSSTFASSTKPGQDHLLTRYRVYM